MLFLQLGVVAYACEATNEMATMLASAGTSAPCHGGSGPSREVCVGHCLAISQAETAQLQPVVISPAPSTVTVVAVATVRDVDKADELPPAIPRPNPPLSRLPVLRL